MLATSGTYNFQSIQIELIIREAFENIGILGEFTELQKMDSARRSLDLIQLEWMNRAVNLWTRETIYLPLEINQNKYTLLNTVNNLIQANLRTFTRQLNGTAASSGGGNADNAFDGNPLTSCTQNVGEGNISYDYGVGVTQVINFIGIQSNATNSYLLIVEFSQDNVAWQPFFVIPQQSYPMGFTVWVETPFYLSARAYRIKEDTGFLALDIRELYFTNNINDMPMAEVSRYEYLNYPDKQQSGRPNIYYLDRQITPILNIWPVPTDINSCLQLSYERMLQDVGSLYTNTLEIPSRFYPALIWALTWRLAIKYKPEQADRFKAEYEQSFNYALTEDSESTTMSIHADYTRGCYE